ncbi:hypothetical protein LEP1GSC190_17040 [Leptospira mayottensis 200901116]|uniref:Uncharacterized protein n=1 Tax=Leptospira mayottensis 200901122 TaxID=1193010 RepID=A0AA87SYY1_9LEPT|nr:hypothetical protein LEP1GSC190_17040 [Leptospira mayottensis 200901116]EKS01882.1 hypothetical protein LEP1GSC125_3448 [Leptospira mayottensis 200901122]
MIRIIFLFLGTRFIQLFYRDVLKRKETSHTFSKIEIFFWKKFQIFFGKTKPDVLGIRRVTVSERSS